MAMKLNEYELIYLIREQSEEALEMLLEKYKPFIGKLASRYRVKGIEYEDFLQEGLVACNNAIYSYNEYAPISFYTYCMTCSKNAMITYYNKAYRVTSIEDDYNDCLNSGYEINEVGVYNYRKSFDEQLHQKFIVEQYLSQSNQVLSDLEKLCLKSLLKGHNYKEIAQLHDLPTKTVENAVTRCKVKLRSEALSS